MLKKVAHPHARIAYIIVAVSLSSLLVLSCAGKIREVDVQTQPRQTESGPQFMAEIRGQFGTRSLLNPVDIEFDASRNLYIVDKGNNRVVKLGSDFSFMEENGGYGLGINGLNSPAAITTDGGIHFFVLDQGNDRVVRSDYNLVFADELRFDASPELVSLGKVTDIGFSRFNNMYLLDPDNLRTVVLDKDYAISQELMPAGGFTNCTSIFISSESRIYIYDSGANSVFTFDSFGNPQSEIALEGIGELGGFVVMKKQIYATDRIRGELVVFDLEGRREKVYDVVSGSQLPRFSRPTGVAVSPDSKLFVCDSGNNRILVYDLAAPVP